MRRESQLRRRERRWTRTVRLLDDYWEALRHGAPTDPARWAQAHPQGPQVLRDLELLAALHDARALVLEGPDSAATSAGAEAKPRRLPPGTQLGQCRIQELLGCGGMGEVYLAEHEGLQRPVAVKLLPARLAGEPAAVQRFRRSVQLLAQLEPHPNIVAALDAGEHQGRLCLVMEYVPGLSLKAHVQQRGVLPAAEACALIRQAALGLQHAHRHGIVHRDIKPSNLMLTPSPLPLSPLEGGLSEPERQARASLPLAWRSGSDGSPSKGERGRGEGIGTVKVLDLGLARLIGTATGELPQTDPDALLGTLDYMAPEQALDARRADARSDLYSLGCTFYFLLVGRPPFDDHVGLEKVMAHALRDPSPVRQQRPDVPPLVADLVCRLLAKKPDDRFPSARALIEALDAAIAAKESRAHG